MFEQKYTPGPFTIKGPSPGLQKGFDDGGDYAIIDPEGKVIGEAIYKVDWNEFRPARANAQLWASALKLLKTLQRLFHEVNTRDLLDPHCYAMRTSDAIITNLTEGTQVINGNEQDHSRTINIKLLELMRGAVHARDNGEQLFDDWYDEARAAIAETEGK